MTTQDHVDLSAEMDKAASLYYARDFKAVERLCAQLLTQSPGHPDVLNILALAQRASKNWNAAEATVRQGLKGNANHVVLLNTLGLILLDQRRFAEAETTYKNALDAVPDNADLRVNLALALHEQGRLDPAAAELTRIIDAGVEAPNPFLLRAAIRAEHGLFDLARDDLDQAERRGAPAGDIATARAHCALSVGDFESAFLGFDSAVSRARDPVAARIDRGAVKLMQGRIADGWDDYAARLQKHHAITVIRPLPYPQWRGEPLAGKTLLLWTEQGLGEAILGSTMVTDVLAEADRVVLECDSRLTALFRCSFPHAEVVAQHTPPDPALAQHRPDYQASLLDLIRYRAAGRLGQTATTPSLQCDPDQTAALRAKYTSANEAHPLVGLSWSSPQAVGGRVKGIPPALWEPVLSVPGLTFVNLQYGPSRTAMADVARACGATLVDDGDIDPGGPLDGPADQIAALDLVISVSTTAAHLAGALGQKTWIIVPPIGPAAMWYWFLDREDSPWYPGARLFRRHYGDGQDAALMDEIGRSLEAWRTARG